MDSSSVGPSLSSSSSLDATKLTVELIADEKENMRRWLRAEMDSLVDPLIEKLFDKFKFTNSSTLGLKKSNDGNAQIMDQTVEYVEPELNHPHQSKQSLKFIESQTYSSFMNINNRLEVTNSAQHNSQHEIINCSQSSSQTQNGQIHFESISNSKSSAQFTNSLPTFKNGPTNFDPQSIKQEIRDEPIADQINCPSTANLADLDDNDADVDCECDDCANGGICGIKEEDDENYMIEISDNGRDDNREQPMNKKPRMDTTQPNSHGNQQMQTPTDRFMVELQASSSRQKAAKDPSRQQHKPQLCNYPGCERQFRDLTDLTRHKRTHLGIRPYRCRWPDCGFAATHRTNTLTHIRRKHLTIGDRDLQANEIAVYVEVVRELL